MSIDAAITLTFERPVVPVELVSHLTHCGWTFSVYGSINFISPENLENADWVIIDSMSFPDYLVMVERFSTEFRDFVLLLARSNDMVGGSWHFMDGYRKIMFSPTVNALRSPNSDRIADFTEYVKIFVNIFAGYATHLCEVEVRQTI